MDPSYGKIILLNGASSAGKSTLPALAEAGNNLVIDYIIETRDQLDPLMHCIGHLDVFFVGVHCPLAELERRELQRGDRSIGDARRDLETVHSFSTYDLEVDSSQPLAVVAEEIIAAWHRRPPRGVFTTNEPNVL